MERFFGGNPVAVLLKLAVISVIVGIVLAAFDLTPADVLDRVVRLGRRIYEQGFEAIEWGLQYFLLGAVIVFPIWLLARVFRSRKSDS